MKVPDGYLPLTETARAVREMFERAGIEPERPITYWSCRKAILDGVVVAERRGVRLFIPARDLPRIAARFGFKHAPAA